MNPSITARQRALRPNLRVALFTGKYNYLREGANQALNRLVTHLEAEADATVRETMAATAC